MKHTSLTKILILVGLLLGVLGTGCQRLALEMASSEVSVQSIEILPGSKTLPKNIYFALQAIAHYSDGTTADITSQCNWFSNDSNVVALDNTSQGVGSSIIWIVGQTAGSARIVATFGDMSADSVLTITGVNLNSISISPSSLSLAKGLTQQMSATGHFSDGSTEDITATVTWTSTNTSVASFSTNSGEKGLVKAIDLGSSTLQASFNSVDAFASLTGTAPVLTSISVSPSTANIALGLTQQFSATGTYSDGTTVDLSSTATWSSSDPLKISIDSNGLATSLALGAVTLQASMSGVHSSVNISAVPANLISISVTPAAPSVAKGLTKQFIATGHYTDGSTADITNSVTWSSSDPLKASVNSSGLASTLQMGSVTISAVKGSVNGGTSLTITAAQLVSIAVTPNNATIILALNMQFTATGTYTDGSTTNITTSVTWSSSNSLVATISNSSGTEGRATGVGLGSTTIKATSGSISGQTNLNGLLF